jgi:hypothetical protein
LRETAASATAASHHCAVVLHTLGTRAAQLGAAVSTELLQSTVAAEQAREAWLHAATMWKQLATDAWAAQSPISVETVNLALRTGRLAIADPAWKLTKGPGQPARRPQVARTSTR